MLILSKERNPVVEARGRKLGIEVRQGIDDKRSALAAWAAETGVDLADVVYVGNDVNDIECLEMVGWPVAVADAHPQVVPHVRVLLRSRGGEGALRELTDSLLSAHRGANDDATEKEMR
jgi:N-acylneuraminate cytidylyltransferase